MAFLARESDPTLADSTTIESQAKACREYGKKQGYVFDPKHSYMEAVSGYSVPYTERIVVDMLDAAKRREFDVLVVTEIRALGRKQVEIFVIYDQLQKYGVRLEAISEKFEDSAMGRLILSLRAAFSEIEHDQILLRLERGKRDRVEISKALNGHAQAGYGHVFVDTQREQKAAYAIDTRVVLIDDDGREWTPVSAIRFMRDLVLQGKGVRSIALMLTEIGIPTPEYGKTRKGKPVQNVWHWATVYRILTDQRIMGVVYANKYHTVDRKRLIRTPDRQIRLPDAPPIISEEEFYKIQERLKINGIESARNNKHSREAMGLFRAGYCVCGICNCRMTVRYHSEKHIKKNPNPEYICRKKLGRSDLLHFHTTSISQPVLDREGWKRAVEVILNPSLVRERVELIRQQQRIVIDRESVEAVIASLDKQLGNLFTLAQQATTDDTINRLAQTLNELERQKQEAVGMLYDVQEEEEEREKLEAAIVRFEQWAADVRPLLGDPTYLPTYDEQRLTIRIIGLQATIYPASGGHPFRYKFELAPPEIMKLLSKHWVLNEG